jgi:hypothetical protein
VCVKGVGVLQINFDVSVNITLGLSTPSVMSVYLSVYLSLQNADLLVRTVIIKLTRRRKGGIRGGGIRGGGTREGGITEGEIGEGGSEGICFCLPLATFRFHSVTCSCIVELREFSWIFSVYYKARRNEAATRVTARVMLRSRVTEPKNKKILTRSADSTHQCVF